jgi:hypothetical protein
MRLLLALLSLLIFTVSFGAPQQKQHANESCGFAIQGEPTQPTVTGPDDLLPLVYVVEQPDSPIEVASVDLQGMWLSVANGQHTEKDCAKYRIRNRSDQAVQDFSIMLRLSTIGGAGGGSGTLSSAPLPPGKSVDVESCGVRGSGGATDNYVRLLVYVDSAVLGDCFYKPSLRIPRSLKVTPAW